MYNAEKDLEHLFDSLLWQTRPIDEIIFVDNMSKDRSLAMCKGFQEKYSDKNIKVLQEQTKGPSAARNAGLKRPHRPYLH